MAIALYQKVYPGGKSDIFEIEWRPYYLNYGPSTHSVDKSELVDAKLSGMTEEQRRKLFRRMDQIGKAVGINFQAGGKIGDTRQAHRLVHLSRAAGADVQGALVDKIFQAYHELEKDITSKEVLNELAISSGIDAKQAKEWMDSGIKASEVDEEARRFREQFKDSGVPTYVIQGTHRLNGAQDPQDLMDVFIKVRENEG